MNIINQIKAWYNKVVADAKQKRLSLWTRSLAIESHQVLQVMEYQGDLFICYKGLPIVREDQLSSTIPAVLEESRNTYIEFINNNNNQAMENKIRVVFELTKEEIQAIGFVIGETIPEHTINRMLQNETIVNFSSFKEEEKMTKLLIGSAALVASMKESDI